MYRFSTIVGEFHTLVQECLWYVSNAMKGDELIMCAFSNEILVKRV